MNKEQMSNEVTVSFGGGAVWLCGRWLLAGIMSLLVIPGPWAVAALCRWVVENLTLSDGTQVKFTGKGADIWPLIVLMSLEMFAVTRNNMVALLICIPVGLWVCILMLRWFVRSVSLSCGTVLSFSGTVWECVCWIVLYYVSCLILIPLPWVLRGILRWFCRSIQGDEHTVEFVGTVWELFWRLLVSTLACFLIIPIPWAMWWLFRWCVANVRIREIQEALEA